MGYWETLHFFERNKKNGNSNCKKERRKKNTEERNIQRKIKEKENTMKQS